MRLFVIPALLAATAAAIPACSSSEAPGCRIAQVTTLPPTPLAAAESVRLERAGDGLVLLGSDGRRDLVHFARLDAGGGALAGEVAVTVPPRLLGPVFAATARSRPADQLVVIYGVARGPTTTALQVITAGAGASAASSPAPLLDPAGVEILLEGDPTSFELALGSTRSGQSAVLAWGNRTEPVGPRLLLVKGDGVTANPAVSIGVAAAPWDCLAIVPGRADFGVQRMIRASGADPTWSFLDFLEDGSVSYTLTVQAPHAEIGCPLTTPSPIGYAFAWQNREGSYFTDVDATGPQPLVTSDIVRAAVHFGGPDEQPPLSCIASMGKDYALVFGQDAGPLVHRFDLFGVPRGGYLYLPSRGRPGPVTAWPEVGAAFVTYLDRGAIPADDRRQLVKVDCPVASP